MNDAIERFQVAVCAMAQANEVAAAGVVERLYDANEKRLSRNTTIGGHLLAVAALLITRAAELGVPPEQIARAAFAARPDTPTNRPYPTR